MEYKICHICYDTFLPSHGNQKRCRRCQCRHLGQSLEAIRVAAIKRYVKNYRSGAD